MAKARSWCVNRGDDPDSFSDAERRRAGEQSGLETHVVQPVNHVHESFDSGRKFAEWRDVANVRSAPPEEYSRKGETQKIRREFSLADGT